MLISSSPESVRKSFSNQHIKDPSNNQSMNFEVDKIQQIEVEINSVIEDGYNLVNVGVKAPKAPEKRDPVAIICVLDISGSMDCESSQTGAESDGFTRLDLVKHSVNTIVTALDNDDLLGIVTFSNSARVDFNLANMTEEGKNKAYEVVKKMKTEGATNLWDGIYHGLELSKNEKCNNKNTFVIVLSDGEPNQHPPNGEWQATQDYFKTNTLRCSMSMFGYGYNLDTNLLGALTEIGGGCFGFIPDCSMIGTIFVNFLSAALSSFAPKLTVSIDSDEGRMVEFNGDHELVSNLGLIQYGVTRNCFLKFKAEPQLEVIANLNVQLGSEIRAIKTIKIENSESGTQECLRVQQFRYEHIRLLVKSIQDANQNLEGCLENFLNHAEEMKKFHADTGEKDDIVGGLIRDIVSDLQRQGQISIALSKPDFWKKWGLHYFHALKIAHRIEMSTNFKDPGLQYYGGELFKSLQDSIDTIFIKLPPPQPSISKFDAHGNLKQVYSMDDYYDVGGGCIHENCLAALADGTHKTIRSLKKGDLLKGGAKIVCAVKTPIEGLAKMTTFSSGLSITQYHPIKQNGKWVFPITVGNTEPIQTEAYYNFVIEGGVSMEVNGIECITLGHGITNDKVAEHSYFGSQLIIQDLKQMKGWDAGLIVMERECFRRNPLTMMVEGIQRSQIMA